MRPERQIYQSDASYRRVLRELRRRVLAGVKLTYFDDDAPGNKRMGCSWGTCDDNLSSIMDGIYPTDRQPCPHDSRFFTQDGTEFATVTRVSSGCFYTCRIFKAKKGDRETARARVLKATEGLDDAS
jgi:hypothetical protein